MKTFITVLALAALTTTSAMAQAPKVKPVRTNLAHIYQSDAQGNQTFPNPDRDFGGEYFYSQEWRVLFPFFAVLALRKWSETHRSVSLSSSSS